MNTVDGLCLKCRMPMRLATGAVQMHLECHALYLREIEMGVHDGRLVQRIDTQAVVDEAERILRDAANPYTDESL